MVLSADHWLSLDTSVHRLPHYLSSFRLSAAEFVLRFPSSKTSALLLCSRPMLLQFNMSHDEQRSTFDFLTLANIVAAEKLSFVGVLSSGSKRLKNDFFARILRTVVSTIPSTNGSSSSSVISAETALACLSSITTVMEGTCGRTF